jgi:hypothetical protein
MFLFDATPFNWNSIRDEQDAVRGVHLTVT